MAGKKVDSETLTRICQLAGHTESVRITQTAQYDLMAHQLNKADICDEIVEWIKRGDDMKETTFHSHKGLVGQPAYVLKPRLNNRLFYVKLALLKLNRFDEHMLIVSAHPDH